MALHDPLGGPSPRHVKELEKQFAEQATRMASVMKAVWDDKGYKKVFADLKGLQNKMMENALKQSTLEHKLALAHGDVELKKRLQGELEVAKLRGATIKRNGEIQEQSVSQISKRLEGAMAAIGDRQVWQEAHKNAGEFAEKFGDGISDAFDEATKGGAAGIGKLLKRAGAMATKGGAMAEKNTMGGAIGNTLEKMGGFLSTIGPAIAAIGAVALGLAAVVKIILDADSKVKELNKEILGAGISAGDLVDSLGEVDRTLSTVRHSFAGLIGGDAQKFVQDWGVSAKENLQILNSFATAGYTVNEMIGGMKDLNEQQKALRDTTATAMTYAKLLGESSDKIAGDMGEMMENMSMGLHGVAERFSDITKAAMESGFGTKRFYGMVVQLTTGMSMYNVRLDETLGMLTMLGKLMSPKKAAEFAGTLTKGFKDATTEERLLTGKKMGGKNRSRLGAENASSTAGAFQDTLKKAQGENPDMAKAIAKAMADARLNPDVSPEEFAAQTSKMTQTQTDALTFALNEIKGQLGTQFAAQQQASLGLRGGAGDQTAAMKAWDPVTTLLAKGHALEGIPGMGRLDQVKQGSITKNMAAEKLGGMSPEQIEQVQGVFRHATGMQAKASQMKGDKNVTQQDIDKFNDTIGKEFNVVMDPLTKELKDKFTGKSMAGDDNATVDKLVRSSMESAAEKAAKTAEGQKKQLDDIEAEKKAQVSADRAIAMKTADATTAMADRMESVIEGLLQSIDDSVTSILRSMPGWMKGEGHAQKDWDKEQKKSALKDIDDYMDGLQTKLKTETDPAERARLNREVQGTYAQRKSVQKSTGGKSEGTLVREGFQDSVAETGGADVDHYNTAKRRAGEDAERLANFGGEGGTVTEKGVVREMTPEEKVAGSQQARAAGEAAFEDKALGGSTAFSNGSVLDALGDMADSAAKGEISDQRFEKDLQLKKVPVAIQAAMLKALKEAHKESDIETIMKSVGVDRASAEGALAGNPGSGADRAIIEQHRKDLEGLGVTLPVTKVKDAVRFPSGQIIEPDPGDTVAFGKPGGALSKGGGGSGNIVNIHVYHDVSVPKMIRDAFEAYGK